MSKPLQILLVEDEKIDQLAYSRFVERERLPYETVMAGTLSEARTALRNIRFDVVITDYFLGPDTALDLLAEIRNIPSIVVTGLGDEEIAVNAMKLGASDYMTKDSNGNYLKMLPQVVANAIKLKQVENELVLYRENLEKMVVERTEELSLANRLLRDEIEERRQAQEQILLQSSALESAVNGIMIMDRGGMILWVNSALLKMTGYGLESLLGHSPDFIRREAQDEPGNETLWGAVEMGQAWLGRVAIVRRDGGDLVADTTVTPVTSDAGQVTHFIAICNDITEKLHARQELEHLATHDTLTDLPNRLLFSDRLNHALARSARAGGQGAVLIMDLDDFKAINDAFSHEDGDEFIKVVAGRLTASLRESDTVARIGGDEFAVLLENIEQESVGIVAEKLNRVIAEPVAIRGNSIVSTASIGVCLFPQDGNRFLELLKNADLAMYQAKELKNTHRFYDQGLAARMEKQMELTNYLRHALHENIFQLHYQPQVDSLTGRVIGMEALLRLPHPQLKWIPPSEFIPLAEKTGLITAIDEWVLRTAGRKLRDLREAGHAGLSVSVNLSSRLLSQPNLFPILEEVLASNNLDPACLELEISEGSVIRNPEAVIEALAKLKAMKVKLAIDDFGTGYASLNYLAHFPLNTLKIDLSFTRKVLSSRRDAAIITGVVAIADSLGLDIIVEGVERPEQLDFFSRLGCRLIQGYIYSAAIPGERLDNILRDGFPGLAR